MPIVREMEAQYVKISRIAEDLAEHPMLRDIPFDRIINYVQELMQIIGSPKLFLEKTAIVKITNYRGELPCDFVNMIQVRGAGCIANEYVSATDNFHMADRKRPSCIDQTATYRIQGNVIITSKEHEDVEIAYTAIPVDENGWPMLPDNAVFIRAVESYIKMRRFNILFDQGQISQNVFTQAQQDYYFNAGQAQTELLIPTEDEMETITNMWNTLIPRVTEHRNGFATAHNKEFIRRH